MDQFQVIKNKPLIIGLKYLLILIPSVVSFFVVNKYALNIPLQDDYDAVLNFLCVYKGAHGMDKFYLLFVQQGEHRIFSSRMVYVLYDALAGNINFRHLIFIGNVQLLLLFFMLTAFIRRSLPGYWLPVSFIAGLCLFDLNNWENAGFAMAAMQNYGIIFLFMAAMYFYSLKGRAWLFVAVICQVICTYSSGNGIIASGFLMVYTILEAIQLPAGTGKLKPLISSIVFLVFSPLYFLHYLHIDQPHGQAAVSKMISWFFRFAGNHIYLGDYALSVCIGIIVIALLVVVLPFDKRFRLPLHSLPFVCLAGFLLASMAVAAVFRSGMGDYIPSRYLVYPHLLIALVCILAMIKLKDKKVAMPVAILFTLLMLVTYNMNFRGGLKDFARLKDTLKNTDYYYPHKEAAKDVANRACQAKIYCIEDNR